MADREHKLVHFIHFEQTLVNQKMTRDAPNSIFEPMRLSNDL